MIVERYTVTAHVPGHTPARTAYAAIIIRTVQLTQHAEAREYVVPVQPAPQARTHAAALARVLKDSTDATAQEYATTSGNG
jgi:hypothetical protein